MSKHKLHHSTAHPWRQPFIPTPEPVSLAEHLSTIDQRFKNKALRDLDLEEGDNLSDTIINRRVRII